MVMFELSNVTLMIRRYKLPRVVWLDRDMGLQEYYEAQCVLLVSEVEIDSIFERLHVANIENITSMNFENN